MIDAGNNPAYVGRYRKRPVIVEAIRWDGKNSQQINDWIPGSFLCWSTDHAPCINTTEGMMRAELGDWIIKGVKGEFYPCKPDVFSATYDHA